MKNSQDLLNAIPVRTVEYEEDENSSVFLINQKSKSPFINRILDLFQSPRYFRVKLDNYGSRCWKLADGSRTVLEICRALEKEFAGQIEQAESRTVLFFYQLFKAGQIKFYKKTEEGMNE